MLTSTYLRLLSTALILSLAGPALAQARRNDSPLAAGAPTDQPVALTGEYASSLREFEQLIAPAVKQAHKTLPKARQRFTAGLPAGQAFFLTTRIFDTDGRFEQVFVRVKNWSSGTVQGLISNELNVVQQYKPGQLITFPETAVLDWTISTADGREEGNFVGKLLDSLQR